MQAAPGFFRLLPLLLLSWGTLVPAQEILDPPRNAQLVEAGLRKITLSWLPSPSAAVAGYVIYRQDVAGGPFSEVATLRGWQTSRFTDEGKVFNRLKDSTLYVYSVAAFADNGEISAPSPAIRAITDGPPAPILNFQVVGGPKKISLRWTASPELEVTGYRIWRATSRDMDYSRVGSTHSRDATSFTDRRLDDRTKFYYMVTAINTKGVESEPCQPVSASTLSPPLSPASLTAGSNTADRILVTWSPNPERNLSHYEVLRSTKSDRGYSVIGQAAARDQKFIDLEVKPGTLYFYSLMAVDLDGLKSQPSSPVRAFTRSPPIAPSALSARMEPGGLVLEWTRSADPHTAGYLVYQKQRYAWRQVGRTTGTRFQVQDLSPEDVHRFRVSAFLSNGLESQHSEILKVDLQRPPSADGTMAIVRTELDADE